VKGDRSLLAPGGTILAVDDQAENLELLEALLTEEGYDVVLAADGEKALAYMAEGQPDCIILDIMMPRLDGYEVCTRLKADPRTQFVPIVMLTALSAVEDKVRGLEAGADDFLNKPVRREELLARVRSLVRIKRLRDELDSSASIIFTMVRALESKDQRNAGHSERVAAGAMALARRLQLSPSDRDAVAKGALLHDVGKLGIPDEALSATGLTAEQATLRREHPVLGERILLPLRSMARAREVVRHHHERLDGSGFPDGLFGKELSLPAEIVGLANEYDDLVNQEGLSPGDAADRVREETRKGRFHAEVVEAFLESGAAVIGSRGDPVPDAWSELLPMHEVSRTGTIVVGDDTRANREMFLEILGEAGFNVIPVDSGRAVLAAVQESEVDLVLLDIHMPALDGFTVCDRLKHSAETEFLPVVLVSAFRGAGDRVRGVDVGADDFLTIPVNSHELLARVRSLLRLRTFHRDLEDHQSVVLSLASLLEAKDPYTRGHSVRVGELAARLAVILSFPPEECELMQVAGLLHDIGKVGVPGSLINKPGRLTPEEFVTVAAHAADGESLCRPLKTVQNILPLIRHHHEWFDGRGYPDRLKGEEIPRGARLLALCDAYDALTSDRSYRARLSPREALSLLAEETTQGKWDPEIFGALRDLVEQELG
jgi:putative two-component system response regulator